MLKNNLLLIFMFFCLSLGTIVTVWASGNEEIVFTEENTLDYINEIALNKVIVIGDSRMEFLLKDDDVRKPINFTFIAKSGAGFNWFLNTAISELEELLDNKDDSYYYHVVFNLGVNDIQYTKDIKEIFESYMDEFAELKEKYADVSFYFLSVNPIDEDLLNKYQPQNIRTNDMIEKLNGYFIDELKDYEDFYYCDAYHDIDFETGDGIHYESVTSQDTLNYIAQSCLKYK